MNLCGPIGCDEVVSLRWSHPDACVGLTVELPLHKEVALLLEVDVTVGAHEATGVTIFVTSLDHCPSENQIRKEGHVERPRRETEDIANLIFVLEENI